MGCFVTLSISVLVCVLSQIAKDGVCQVLRLQDLNVLELQFVLCQQIMIKTLRLGLGLLKVCLFVKLDSIDRTTCRFIFLQKFQFSPSPFAIQVFVFYSKYKRINPNYVLEVFLVSCVESFVRSKGVYLHTHTQGYQDQDSCQELGDLFSCCTKNFKEDLEPLSGVSKLQVGELVVTANQRKKQSVDSKLSRGRGSKFST